MKTTVKRFEERATERFDRLNLIFEYAEAVSAYIQIETENQRIQAMLFDNNRVGIKNDSGNLELF